MTFHSSPKSNRTAIICALCSQTVWLPLLFMDSQDQKTSKVRDYDFSSLAKIPQQQLPKELELSVKTLASSSSQIQTHSAVARSNSGMLLNPVFRGLAKIDSQKHDISTLPTSTISNYTSIIQSQSTIDTPASQSHGDKILSKSSEPSVSRFRSTTPLLRQLFTNSELLGGTLTLKDLNEPQIPPLARAERAKWSRTGDPLAPLPQMWREPMRKALAALNFETKSTSKEEKKTSPRNPTIDTARIIHVPSAIVRRSTEVPLALQSDGTVDILNQPDDPGVIDEIKRWSVKQQLPSPGSVTPAVVHLHALSQPDKALPQPVKTLPQPVQAKIWPAEKNLQIQKDKLQSNSASGFSLKNQAHSLEKSPETSPKTDSSAIPPADQQAPVPTPPVPDAAPSTSLPAAESSPPASVSVSEQSPSANESLPQQITPPPTQTTATAEIEQ